MRLGYLMNTYPLTSTTFIRREIEAHEASGIDITRLAVRPWEEELVDEGDRKEKQKTIYLLGNGISSLVTSCLVELATNPISVVKSFGVAVRLWSKNPKKVVEHIAYFLEAIKLKQIAKKQDLDHLHVHFSTNSTAVALLSKLLGGPSYSFTVHGPNELNEVRSISLKTKAIHAKSIIAITEYCKMAISNAIAEEDVEKIQVVRCGIFPEDFKPTTGYSSQEFVCVGRLCKEKAQATLVEAFAGLLTQYPSAKLTLIGDGDDRPYLEEMVRSLGISESVSFDGWGTNEEVRAAIGRSRALVLPSLAEGLPIVLMEAFAAKVPVISTDIHGIPELLDGTCGWLVAPGSVEATERALKDCASLSEDELAQKGEAGYRRVIDLHDQRKNASKLRELLASS